MAKKSTIPRWTRQLIYGAGSALFLVWPFVPEATQAWHGGLLLLSWLAAACLLWGRWSWMLLLAGLSLILILLLGWALPPALEAGRAYGRLGYALAVLLGLFGFQLLGLAGHVLPIQSWAERRRVFGRLVLYLLGRHGPALFVRDGRAVAGPGELQRKGPGVMVVDAHSAAALERRTWNPRTAAPSQSAVRIVGAGLHFTDADEVFRRDDVLDLRLQTRRTSGVRALTADGVEVVVGLTVTFRLTPTPVIYQVTPPQAWAGQGDLTVMLRGANFAPGSVVLWNGQPCSTIRFSDTELRSVLTAADLRTPTRARLSVVTPRWEGGESAPITFAVRQSLTPGQPVEAPIRRRDSCPLSRASAFDAIYGQAASNLERVRWAELPLLVAKELFREQLAQTPLDRLFDQRLADVPPLAAFRAEFAQRMKTSRVLVERGVRVLSASVGPFSFVPPGSEAEARGVRDQWLQSWLTTQRRQEHRQRAQSELVAGRVKAETLVALHGNWMRAVTEFLAEDGRDPQTRHQAALVLYQMLNLAASDAARRRLLPDEVAKVLENVQGWFLNEPNA